MATEILVRGGLFVGEDLIGANDSNPYGHFEDRQIVRLHDDILREVGLTWQVAETFVPTIRPKHWRQMARIADGRRARHRRWGFKDPRVCFFLSAWKYLVPDLRTLVVYRDPRACADSLARRHADQMLRQSGPADVHRQFWLQPDLGLRMWVHHNRALVDFARRHRDDTLMIPHAAIVDGLNVVDAVNHVLGTGLDPVDNREVFDPNAMGSPPGQHPVSSRVLVDDILGVWADLEDLASEDAARYEGVDHALA